MVAGYRQRKIYLKLRAAVIATQKHARSILARYEAAKRKQSVVLVREYIKGFINRKSFVVGQCEACTIPFTVVCDARVISTNACSCNVFLEKRAREHVRVRGCVCAWSPLRWYTE